MKKSLVSLIVFCITVPLMADELVDYFKEFERSAFPPKCMTDDNGFRLFVRQFGCTATFDDNYFFRNMLPKEMEFYRQQIYKKLGLDPVIPPTLTLPREPFMLLQEFYKEKGEDDSKIYQKASEIYQPWTLEQFPMLSDWVKEIDAPMNAIAEAIRKPIFMAPFIQSVESTMLGEFQTIDNSPNVDFQLYRKFARIFQARAGYRIGNGDIDGAIDDQLTILRLGRLMPQKRTLSHHLVGIAIEGTAMARPTGANSEHPLTEIQIRRILEGLDALPQRAPLQDAFESERCAALSTIQDVAFAIAQKREAVVVGWSEFETAKPPWSLITNRFKWEIVYRRVNDMYDAIQEPPPREKFRAMIDALEKEEGWKKAARTFLMPGGIEMDIAEVLIGHLSPAVDSFEGAIQRSECSENMQRLVLAIMLYRLENGKLPEGNWAAQIRKYLGERPDVYFSCPSNPSSNGETTYALIQYDGKVPELHETIFLLELKTPVPFDKAVISIDDALNFAKDSKQPVPHTGGAMTARKSGAVQFISQYIGVPELSRLLGHSLSEP